MNTLLKYTAILMMSSLAQWAHAENFTKVDGYIIHHNALSADSLTPGIAQAYGIQRSKNRGLLTVSVLKDAAEQTGTTGTSVKADIKAHATNLNGQMREITLHEVDESGAIYYVGDFRVSNEETFNFELEVTPEGSEHTYKANLTQEFFTE